MRLSFPAALGLRFAISTALVLGTWNPTGYSWAHYARSIWPHVNGLFAMMTVILTIAWVVLGRATWKALGVIGWVLTAALLGTLVWAASDFGLFDVHNRTVGAWIVVIGIIIVHTVGLSWGDLRRKATPAPEPFRPR
ncbi:MAG: DUF6524 family protein [Archangium sp.]